MKSKRSNEGYFLLDHSNSPGIGAKEINMIDGDLPLGIGRTTFEAPTYTCSHCQGVVVMNPLRKRERAWCANCDCYICDNCGSAKVLGAPCITYNQIMEEILNVGDKGQDQVAVWNNFRRQQKKGET